VTSPIQLDLVADGALRLALARSLYAAAERWIQGLPVPGGAPARALIFVRAHRRSLSRPMGQATLALDRVAAWVDDVRGQVVLRGGLPSSGGVLNLVRGRGRLRVDPARGPDAAADLYSLLTVSAALLLLVQGRALVHAAAVVAPDGGAWLLVGDARSGKSTTCTTLASAGWGYLSDDQVVLSSREDGLAVEGWLRPFHLDGTARLAGTIFPTVSADEPTRLTAFSAGNALARLVRQTPWLLAYRPTCPDVLALLTRVVAGGAFSLRLGRDTYRKPARLAARLAGLDTRVGSSAL
jgi:hypothetical protein